MNLVHQKLVLLFLVVLIVSCSNQDHNMKQLYDSVEKALSGKNDGKLVVSLPPGSSGVIIFSSPYSVSPNEGNIVNLVGEGVTKEISRNSSDDSAFHVFIVDNVKKRIVIYKKWKSPPVAFNNYFAVEFHKTDRNLVLNVSNSVLKSVDVDK